MQIDDTILTGIGVAVSTAIVAMWVQIRAQIHDLRSQLRDAIKRIRELEDERGDTLREVARSNHQLVSSLRSRPCLTDQTQTVPSQTNLPEVDPHADTDRIVRKP